jgi:hypothetical protein
VTFAVPELIPHAMPLEEPMLTDPVPALADQEPPVVASVSVVH